MNYERSQAGLSAIVAGPGRTTEADRPRRRVESVLGAVNAIQNEAISTLDRLNHLRGRLLGTGGDASKPPNPNVPTPVRAELDDVGHELNMLANIISDMRAVVSQLEEI